LRPDGHADDVVEGAGPQPVRADGALDVLRARRRRPDDRGLLERLRAAPRVAGLLAGRVAQGAGLVPARPPDPEDGAADHVHPGRAAVDRPALEALVAAAPGQAADLPPDGVAGVA